MENEKRLIDANVVLAKQFTAGLSDASGNYYGHADVVFVDDIENAPTVDAVEVVRCVNCRMLNMTGYDEDNAHITDLLLQSGFCEMWGKDTQLCNFCSHGERRTDG